MKYLTYLLNIIIYIIAYSVILFNNALIQPSKTFYYNWELIEVFPKQDYLFIHVLYIIWIINLLIIFKKAFNNFTVLLTFWVIIVLFTMSYLLL